VVVIVVVFVVVLVVVTSFVFPCGSSGCMTVHEGALQVNTSAPR